LNTAALHQTCHAKLFRCPCCMRIVASLLLSVRAMLCRPQAAHHSPTTLQHAFDKLRQADVSASGLPSTCFSHTAWLRGTCSSKWGRGL
jgi:hypothetical protein